MIPVGYMAKRISDRPASLEGDFVNIYSVSGCMSRPFADFIDYWKHNGYWFFDSPAVIEALAREHEIDLAGTVLFYYEVHEDQFDGTWERFEPEQSFPTDVTEPASKQLEGFDVVSFYAGTSPECSPLSCNALASEQEVNEHCLLTSEEEARTLVKSGRLGHAEPGPYRIFAVYSVGLSWPPAGV
jgi:hypothetical protein